MTAAGPEPGSGQAWHRASLPHPRTEARQASPPTHPAGAGPSPSPHLVTSVRAVSNPSSPALVHVAHRQHQHRVNHLLLHPLVGPGGGRRRPGKARFPFFCSKDRGMAARPPPNHTGSERSNGKQQRAPCVACPRPVCAPCLLRTATPLMTWPPYPCVLLVVCRTPVLHPGLPTGSCKL